MTEENFTKLDLNMLRQLREQPRATNGYMYLRRQHDFSTKEGYGICLTTLHDHCNLRRTEEKPPWQIKRDVTLMLDELKDKDVLTWSREDDQISVREKSLSSKQSF